MDPAHSLADLPHNFGQINLVDGIRHANGTHMTVSTLLFWVTHRRTEWMAKKSPRRLSSLSQSRNCQRQAGTTWNDTEINLVNLAQHGEAINLVETTGYVSGTSATDRLVLVLVDPSSIQILQNKNELKQNSNMCSQRNTCPTSTCEVAKFEPSQVSFVV